jgi:glutathione synthase/RimK-type ligase-like ATP-grasp enzyme
MKRVLVIGSMNSGGKNDPSVILEHLKKSGLDASLCYWEDLVFDIATGNVTVSANGKDIATDIRPDLVVAVGWYKSGTYAYYRDIAFATALYLDKAGISFWNSEMKKQRSSTKLSCMIELALEGIPVPRTLFSLRSELALPEAPFIVKAVAASRGKSNYLAQTEEEARELLATSTPYIVQPFLPNDHDLRIICFDGKAALVLRRSRAKDSDSHMNNTSQGGGAQWLDVNELPQELLTLASKICIILGREMGGIDLIPDASSPYGYSCLEVNAIPQLTSGFDTDKKLDVLVRSIYEAERETR